MKKKKHIIMSSKDKEELYLEVRVTEEEEIYTKLGIQFVTLIVYWLPPIYLGFFLSYLICLLQDIINFRAFQHSIRLLAVYTTMTDKYDIELSERQKEKLKELTDED